MLLLHTKLKLNILSGSGEKVDLTGFAISSHGYHQILRFLLRLNFINLKPCSLVTLHVKYDNHGCSGFRE